MYGKESSHVGSPAGTLVEVRTTSGFAVCASVTIGEVSHRSPRADRVKL